MGLVIPWTAKEDSIIKEMYPNGKRNEILTLLPGRKWNGVISRASHLKIKRNKFKNDYKICGDFSVIYLNRKDGSLIETIIDTEDLEVVLGICGRWKASYDRKMNQFYVTGYLGVINGKSRWISMHRFLKNAPDGMEVDHFNHDTLDNRKDNLRIITLSGNRQNLLGANCANKYSGERNVYWDVTCNKWKVKLSVNKREYFLGSYGDKQTAIEVARKARKELMPYSLEAAS